MPSRPHRLHGPFTPQAALPPSYHRRSLHPLSAHHVCLCRLLSPPRLIAILQPLELSQLRAQVPPPPPPSPCMPTPLLDCLHVLTHTHTLCPCVHPPQEETNKCMPSRTSLSSFLLSDISRRQLIPTPSAQPAVPASHQSMPCLGSPCSGRGSAALRHPRSAALRLCTAVSTHTCARVTFRSPRTLARHPSHSPPSMHTCQPLPSWGPHAHLSARHAPPLHSLTLTLRTTALDSCSAASIQNRPQTVHTNHNRCPITTIGAYNRTCFCLCI